MYISQHQLTTNLGSFEGPLGQTAEQLLAQQRAAEQQAAAAGGPKPAATAAGNSAVAGVAQILGAVGTIGAQFYAAHTQAELEKKRMKYQQNAPAPGLDPALIAALTQPQRGGGSSTTIIIAVVVILAMGLVGYLLMSGSQDEDYGSESQYAEAGPQYGPPAPQRQIKRVRRVKKRKKRP